MKVEELVKEDNFKEKDKQLGIIKREFRSLKSLLRAMTGKRSSEEEVRRNKDSWEGRLFENHPYISAGILLGLTTIPVASFAYNLVTIAEYLKNIYTN